VKPAGHSTQPGPVLTYRRVSSGEQYDDFLQLMRADAADYLDRTMELMHMSWEQFVQLALTVGQLYGIHRDDHLVGYCWTEERGKVVHLHGLVVKASYRGQGIATAVLNGLADRYRGSMDAIELGVHQSNVRARALYARLGYRTIKRLDDLGFEVMQRPLAEERAGGGT